MRNISKAQTTVIHQRQHPALLSKILLCLIGLFLFATNPWRDLHFYKAVAAHEGFGTTAETYIIGFAGQLVLTMITFPIAVFLIIFGIGRTSRISALPRFDRLTWGWGTFASVAAALMIWIEAEYVIYFFKHPHHWRTALFSIGYIAFIYFWWCCSLSHAGESLRTDSASTSSTS